MTLALVFACPEDDPPPTECLPDGGELAGAYTVDCFVIEEGVTATAVDDVVIVVTGEWPVRIDGSFVGVTKDDGDGASITLQSVSPIVVTGIIEAGHGASPADPGGSGGMLALQSSLDVDLTKADHVGAGHGGDGVSGAAGGRGGDLVLQYTQVFLDDREGLIGVGNGGHGGDEAHTFESLAVFATGGTVAHVSTARGGNGGKVVFGGPVFWPDTVQGTEAILEAQERSTSGGTGGNAGSIEVTMGNNRSSPKRWFRWLTPRQMRGSPGFDDLIQVSVTGADGGYGTTGGNGASVQAQKPDTPSTGRGIYVDARAGNGGYGFGGNDADGFWRTPRAGHGGNAIAHGGDAAPDASRYGGRSRVYGGDGGVAQGYLQFDEFGQQYWVTGHSGDGGEAIATGGDGSPGAAGGAARAYAGDGGDASVAPTADAFDITGSGGTAEATAGDGGHGDGDCATGGAGQDGGDGGGATANGGNGGANSPASLYDNCVEAGPWTAYGGHGIAISGNGGDGGDGDPPGAPGDGGDASASTGNQEGPCAPTVSTETAGVGGGWGTECNPGDDDTGDDDTADDDDTGDDDTAGDDDTGDDDTAGDDDTGDDDSAS